MRRTRAADNSTILATPIDTNTGGYYTAGPPATVFSVDDANILQEELVALATINGASLDVTGLIKNQCASAVSGSVKSIDGTSSFFESASTGVRKTIIGTTSASIDGINSSIIGGQNNTISGGYNCIIGAGVSNQLSGVNSAILGSEGVTFTTPLNSVAFGVKNLDTIRSTSSAFIAGEQLGGGIGSKYCAIMASNGAYIEGTCSAMIGVNGGYLQGSLGSFMGGGEGNYNWGNSYNSIVLGGLTNEATQGTSSAIITSNTSVLTNSMVSSIISSITGRLDWRCTGSAILATNRCGIKTSSKYCANIGGEDNLITMSFASVILGGQDSGLCGSSSAIIGGTSNSNSGTNSVIIGGSDNKIIYHYGFIAASQLGTASSVGGVGGSSVISSYSSSCGASFGTVLASEYCNAGPNYYTAFIGDSYCSSSNINQTNMTVLSSRYVTLGLGGGTSSYQVVGGYNGTHSGVAPSWRIASNGGIIHATNTTLQGLDYAELFVNFDKKKHSIGRILTRKGAAAKLAHFPFERILGVVSACPNIIGGSDNLTWHGEWLKDEWGAFIMETINQTDIHPDGTITSNPIVTRKRNPQYDPVKIHTPRTERPDEWTVVGLLGQIRVAIDETVEEDDFVVSGPNGIGTKSDLPGKGRSIECMQIEIPFSPEVGYGVALCLVG